MMLRTFTMGLLLCCFGLTACDNNDITESLVVTPSTLTSDAIGYYCRMGLMEHDGPQAQMFVEGTAEPIWFSQVRDVVVYLRSPEELRKASMVFVNDMGVAESWESPGVDNWIDLDEAFLVIESTRTGGMGAPEVIPFGSEASAQTFVEQFGGRIATIETIPDSYVLAPMIMQH
jgi:copper chaperone NosL